MVTCYGSQRKYSNVFQKENPFWKVYQHNLSLAIIYFILGISERASFLDFLTKVNSPRHRWAFNLQHLLVSTWVYFALWLKLNLLQCQAMFNQELWPDDPAIPLLWMYPQNLKTLIRKAICTPMFTALFTVTKTLK